MIILLLCFVLWLIFTHKLGMNETNRFLIHHPHSDPSFYTPKKAIMSGNAITGEDKECISSLMALKYRAITPPSSSSTTLKKKNKESFPRRVSSAKSDEPSNDATPSSKHQWSKTDSQQQTCSFCVPIGTDEDVHYLDEVQCFIRSHCLEFFMVENKNNDSANTGTSVTANGRIGIRCSFCKHSSTHLKTCGSTYFPTSLSEISLIADTWTSRHLPHCSMIPIDLKNKLGNSTQLFALPRGGILPENNHQFWIHSARKLGLCETVEGIRLHPSARVMNAKPPLPSPTPAAINVQFQSPQFHRKLIHRVSPPAMNHFMHERQTDFNRVSPTIGQTPNYPHMVQRSTSSPPPTMRPAKKNIPFGYFDSIEEYQRHRAASSPSTTTKRDYNKSTPKKASSKVKADDSSLTKDTPDVELKEKVTEEQLNEFIQHAKLVEMKDKDLVPDYLFLAMAQMKPCNLTETDRVGCYKQRKVGFLGMCCKNCGGQPGFGKYFPATVRSLAQTTTSQTIVKHIAVKCRHCPPEVRLALLALQRDQNDKDRAVKDNHGSTFESRPRYGSRKVFFQRIWDRLHGTGDEKITPTTGNVSGQKVCTPKRAVVSPQVGDNGSIKVLRSRDLNNNAKRSRLVSYTEQYNGNECDYYHRKLARPVSS